MVDRLHCLRHNTIVCRHNKNGDICRISAAHTHCSKRFMSRRVKERNLFSVYFCHICTDMLCDSSGFSVDHICVTDCIKKGSLSMVNMPHNTDNRRTLFHLLFVLFILFQKFFNDIHYFFFLTENVKFQRDFFCRFIIHFLIHCNDLALHKQLFDNSRRNNFHLISQLLNSQHFRNHNRFDRLFLFLLFMLRFLHLRFLFLLLLSSLWHSVFIIVSVIFFLIVVFAFILISLRLLSFQSRRRD